MCGREERHMASENRLSAAFRAARDNDPEGTALLFGGKSYSWGWMADRGRALADALSSAGIPEDAPIGLVPRNRPLFVASLIELLVSGRSIVMLRSEEHTSELQSLMRISYAVFCLKNK